MGNPFDSAAARIHPVARAADDAAVPEAAADGAESAPPKRKKKKDKTPEAEAVARLPAMGDAVVVQKSSGAVFGVVSEVKRAKKRKADRGDTLYVLRTADDAAWSTRLTHLDWAFAPAAAPLDADAPTRALRASAVGGALRGGGRIVAPMVGGSELAFRLMCRRYGAALAYTPMIEADKFIADEAHRLRYLQTHALDRPLVAHFCGNDARTVGEACRLAMATGGVDAVDLNLGCPQRVAFSGHYGSYLLGDEDRPTVLAIVAAMRAAVGADVPVCVKIRLLENVTQTIKLVEQLRDAGADVVAVHARRRASWERKGPGARDGPADLDQVRAIVQATQGTVAIVSNGNVRSLAEARAALVLTGAAGVMSAEALLDDPSLFSDDHEAAKGEARGLDLALEYCGLVRLHGNPAGYSSIAFHCRRMARAALVKYDALEDLLAGAAVEDAVEVLERCVAYEADASLFVVDAAKKKRATALENQRSNQKSARLRFEERMIRKAKREKRPLDFYIKQGSTPPSAAVIARLVGVADAADRLKQWNAAFKQHCFKHHLGGKEGCPRGDSCAFIHDHVEDDADLVAG